MNHESVRSSHDTMKGEKNHVGPCAKVKELLEVFMENYENVICVSIIHLKKVKTSIYRW